MSRNPVSNKPFAQYFHRHVWVLCPTRSKLCMIVGVALIVVQRIANRLATEHAATFLSLLTKPANVPTDGLVHFVASKVLWEAFGRVLTLAANLIWLSVCQVVRLKLSLFSFKHLLQLPLPFFQAGKDADVVPAVKKSRSITKFLERMTSDVVPILLGVCSELPRLWRGLDTLSFTCVICTMLSDVLLTLHSSALLAKHRRAANNERRIANDHVSVS